MKPISLTAVEYLTLNMREIDQAEIYNIRNHDNPMLLAREVIAAACYGHAALSEHKGKPSAIIGVTPLWGGVWTVWSFGTDDWRKSVIEISRYGKKVIEPYLRARKAHRVQCESRIDHHEAHRWLQTMGAKPDGLLEAYGRDGSDYILFSWSDKNVLLTA